MTQWNKNYGMLSTIAYYGGLYDKMNLLEKPAELSHDGFLSFGSALYTYMTPVSPAPSMHEVMTGFYVPNPNDQA